MQNLQEENTIHSEGKAGLDFHISDDSNITELINKLIDFDKPWPCCDDLLHGYLFPCSSGSFISVCAMTAPSTASCLACRRAANDCKLKRTFGMARLIMKECFIRETTPHHEKGNAGTYFSSV